MDASLQGELKRGRASLVGGIAVGFAVLMLWVLITRDLAIASTATVLVGVLVAALIAAWIRIADL